MRTFHYRPLTSPAMQKLLTFLRSRGARGATTFEITAACQTTRASSDVSELSANGVAVLTRFEGTNENGRRIYRFILAECVPDELQLA